MPDHAQRSTAPILVAEDNRVNQMVARAMLETLGFDVDVVGDGAQAVAAARRTSFQAILMDCQLPVLDGYQATIEIRRVEGQSRRTPVVAVTGSGMSADRQRCLAAGMDDFLTKPISVAALTVVLTRWAPFGTDPVAGRPGTGDDTGLALVAAAHPADPAAADRPVLDPQVVERLERLGAAAGENLVGQLVPLFLTDAEVRVVEMRDALGADDAAAIVLSAHTLSGSSANVGATRLAGLCANLERHGAAGDLARGVTLVDAIDAELGRVRAALHAWILPPIAAS